MADDRRARGRSLMLGFEIARRAAFLAMDTKAEQLRAAIAVDIEALHVELSEARRELEQSRCEIRRLQMLATATGLGRASLH